MARWRLAKIISNLLHRYRREGGDSEVCTVSQPKLCIGDTEKVFVAFATKPNNLRIAAGRIERDWMNRTHNAFANRCLPLRIANQAGWFILNDRTIYVVWNGGSDIADLTVYQDQREKQHLALQASSLASSHFGHGILTWRIPYLFRTPRGYNLYVRGPTNWCKDGACPLDAVVETDWSVATFTMNWRITRPHTPIIFERDEPICMIFPTRRGELESFRTELCHISEEPHVETGHRLWAESRDGFLQAKRQGDDDRHRKGILWQKHYYKGTTPAGSSFPEHQLKLKLSEFNDRGLKSGTQADTGGNGNV